MYKEKLMFLACKQVPSTATKNYIKQTKQRWIDLAAIPCRSCTVSMSRRKISKYKASPPNSVLQVLIDAQPFL